MTGKTVSGLIFNRTLSFFKNSSLFCYCSLITWTLCCSGAYERDVGVSSLFCEAKLYMGLRSYSPQGNLWTVTLFLYNMHKKFQMSCILRMTYDKITQSIFLRCRHLSGAIITNPAILSVWLSGCIHPSKIQKNISEIYAFIPINCKKAGDDWKSKKTSSCIQEETEYGEKKESKETEQEVSGE